MPETITINLTDHFWDTPPGALYSIAWDSSHNTPAFTPQRYVLGSEPGSVWCDYCRRWWGPDSIHASTVSAMEWHERMQLRLL